MELLRSCLSEWNIDISKEQENNFLRYFELLAEWNNRINLTAITQKDDVIIKHFVDSLAVLKYTDLNGRSLIDIGTGAGFPGIPLKIMSPSCNVVLLDSLNKRINFLNEIISELGLSDIRCIHARAEDAARNPGLRERFDIAISRAVSGLNTLSEYCLPFVNIDGLFISYKSGSIDEELKNGSDAIAKLGGVLDRVEKFGIPSSDLDRSLIFVKKTEHISDRYPRKAGIPEKKPL